MFDTRCHVHKTVKSTAHITEASYRLIPLSTYRQPPQDILQLRRKVNAKAQKLIHRFERVRFSMLFIKFAHARIRRSNFVQSA